MMKSLNLVAISISALLFTGLVSAEDVTTNINQNLSKRPYHQPVVEKEKSNDFEGATLVTEDEATEKDSVSKHKQLRINMLGRRPYVEDVR
jgi:hypothetical protein